MKKDLIWSEDEEEVPGRRMLGTFTGEDERFAVIEGVVYAVLLSAYKKGNEYEEDMSEDDAVWCRALLSVIANQKKVVLASGGERDEPYTFMGLYSVRNIQLTNNLTCRLVKRIARVSPNRTAK